MHTVTCVIVTVKTKNNAHGNLCDRDRDIKAKNNQHGICVIVTEVDDTR